MNELELDNGKLSYQPTKVIYKDKEFPAPVDIITLLAWDYVVELLKKV